MVRPVDIRNPQSTPRSAINNSHAIVSLREPPTRSPPRRHHRTGRRERERGMGKDCSPTLLGSRRLGSRITTSQGRGNSQTCTDTSRDDHMVCTWSTIRSHNRVSTMADFETPCLQGRVVGSSKRYRAGNSICVDILQTIVCDSCDA